MTKRGEIITVGRAYQTGFANYGTIVSGGGAVL